VYQQLLGCRSLADEPLIKSNRQRRENAKPRIQYAKPSQGNKKRLGQNNQPVHIRSCSNGHICQPAPRDSVGTDFSNVTQRPADLGLPKDNCNGDKAPRRNASPFGPVARKFRDLAARNKGEQVAAAIRAPQCAAASTIAYNGAVALRLRVGIGLPRTHRDTGFVAQM
jgi:hypothetical protein